ncbi:MAG: class I SAM-dependent methyltransferase, partial [Candidatus Altiarchaeota archaeon]|nr:class I SAM-dependent methyltransferase [Candidatus Altiarchaeota archaeon]
MTETYLKFFQKYNKILDIGSYDGLIVKMLIDQGKEAIGIDLIQSNKFVIKADAKKLPFKSNSFDCVIFSHIIEHLDFPTLKKILKEVYRVLTDKGIIFIATPIEKDIWDDCSHVRPYTFKSIRQLLEQPEYVGGKWKFKIKHHETKVRANEILRGVFYHLKLFKFYKRFIVPVQNFLKWGFVEIVVMAEAEKGGEI